MGTGTEKSSDKGGRWNVGLTAASVLAAMVSAGIAWVALVKADHATTTAQNLASPLLAPTTPPSERGETITVWSQFAHVPKRADFLYWNSRAQRFVVPVENGGGGIALTVGAPAIVEDCAQEPNLLPRTAVGLLGTYAVPSGGTDQLAYVHPDPHVLRPGHVTVDGRRLWFNFDYRVFRSVADPLEPTLPRAAKLLLWYTDGALRKLYWTCTSYIRIGSSKDGVSQWAVLAQRYSNRSWPGGAPH